MHIYIYIHIYINLALLFEHKSLGLVILLLGNVKDMEVPEQHSGYNISESNHVQISDAKVTQLQAVYTPLYPLFFF